MSVKFGMKWVKVGAHGADGQTFHRCVFTAKQINEVLSNTEQMECLSRLTDFYILNEKNKKVGSSCRTSDVMFFRHQMPLDGFVHLMKSDSGESWTICLPTLLCHEKVFKDFTFGAKKQDMKRIHIWEI